MPACVRTAPPISEADASLLAFCHLMANTAQTEDARQLFRHYLKIEQARLLGKRGQAGSGESRQVAAGVQST